MQKHNVMLTHLIIPAMLCLQFLIPIQGLAASFDCALAKTQVEKNICANSLLSELDNQVHAAYTAAKSNVDMDSVINQQRAWLKERNGCATDKCIELLYKRRLDELTRKQELLSVLRQIVQPKGGIEQLNISRGEEVFFAGQKAFPPYPDIWGVELTQGLYLSSLFPSQSGEVILGIHSDKKNGFAWLDNTGTYVLIGLFSGQVWRTAERDAVLNKTPDGSLPRIKEIPCPVPLSKDDPDGRDTCHAEIDYTFQNGTRLLYVDTSYPGLYCHRERYFRYLVLLDKSGQVLWQVTPIIASKTIEHRDGLGGDSPCEDLPGGDKYINHRVWTSAAEILNFMPLDDGTFLLCFGSAYLVRFDQQLNSRHPALGKELFMVNTEDVERQGNIYSDPRRSIHENLLRMDRKLYEYLINNNESRR